VRIAEVAARVGVPGSTVRYYERIGLLRPPERTASGYRDYDEEAASRLLFITRARHIGLSCDEISELLPIWDGTNCASARGRVDELIERKQSEITERIAELQGFAAQLDSVRAIFETSSPPDACRTDLSCCVPATDAGPVSVPLARKATAETR
jgi:DNA-binding transcriptional MerR regulator